MDSRKELFKVLQSGHFITVLDNKTVEMKDSKDVVSVMDIPSSDLIDFSQAPFPVDLDKHFFMLVFNNKNSSLLVHFSKIKKQATWFIELPNTEVTFFSLLKNRHCVIGRRDMNALLYQYEKESLLLIQQNLCLNDIIQLKELSDNNLLALSNKRILYLLDPTFKKINEVSIPDFLTANYYRLFVSPFGKAYIASYLDDQIQLSMFNISNLKLEKTFNFDLSAKKKRISDHLDLWGKYRNLNYNFLLLDRYIVFVERELFSSDPLFPDRLWKTCEFTSEQTNYWLSIFDFSTEKLLIESELIKSIPSAKLYRSHIDLPPFARAPLPRDHLLMSSLPDGRLIACHSIDKSIILDDDLRNQYQEYMIFDTLTKECLREDVLQLLNTVTLPPLAAIMADYAGFFAVKPKEYKDIPIEYHLKNSCKIL